MALNNSSGIGMEYRFDLVFRLTGQIIPAHPFLRLIANDVIFYGITITQAYFYLESSINLAIKSFW